MGGGGMSNLRVGDHVRTRSGGEAILIGIDGDSGWCRYLDGYHTTQKLEWLERWRSKAWLQIEDERRTREKFGLTGIATPTGNYAGAK